jgi:chromosomal replication initiator protein
VLTSDRLPRDMEALEDRLRERFECGLVTDIRPPDRGTRLTILRKRVAHDGVELGDKDAIPVIADRIVDNVRVLEGALIRVVAYSSLTGRPITGDLAAEVIGGLYPELVPQHRTIREIQLATCDAFGIELDDLLSSSRAHRVTWPRQVAMYLSRELTDRTLPAIGDAFGGRDHTTVMHAVKRTGQRIAADADAYEAVQALTEQLRTSTRIGE